MIDDVDAAADARLAAIPAELRREAFAAGIAAFRAALLDGGGHHDAIDALELLAWCLADASAQLNVAPVH